MGKVEQIENFRPKEKPPLIGRERGRVAQFEPRGMDNAGREFSSEDFVIENEASANTEELNRAKQAVLDKLNYLGDNMKVIEKVTLERTPVAGQFRVTIYGTMKSFGGGEVKGQVPIEFKIDN